MTKTKTWAAGTSFRNLNALIACFGTDFVTKVSLTTQALETDDKLELDVQDPPYSLAGPDKYTLKI